MNFFMQWIYYKSLSLSVPPILLYKLTRLATIPNLWCSVIQNCNSRDKQENNTKLGIHSDMEPHSQQREGLTHFCNCTPVLEFSYFCFSGLRMYTVLFFKFEGNTPIGKANSFTCMCNVVKAEYLASPSFQSSSTVYLTEFMESPQSPPTIGEFPLPLH